jgi:hypothetical protein
MSGPNVQIAPKDGYQPGAGCPGLTRENPNAELVSSSCRGIMSSQGCFDRISVRHASNISGEILDAAQPIINEAHGIAPAIQQMRELQLTDNQKMTFATAASSAARGPRPWNRPSDDKPISRPEKGFSGSLPWSAWTYLPFGHSVNQILE